MALLLNARSLAKSYGPRLLFRGISFGLYDDQHVGLIGPNGSGKSTLLKILAGLEQPDDGSTELRRNLRIGYVAQDPMLTDENASVEHAIASAIDDDHVDEHERLTRANIIIGKIGLPDPQQRVGSLSGGGRKRVAIAREMVHQPELLLMDEPTNHLDYDAIRWLERTLAAARFSTLIVSHDRAFLENVTNRTIELDRAYPDGFLSIDGPYSEFIEKREAFLEAQRGREQAVAGRVRREVEWLKRGAKARTTKAKGRIQQAGKLMEELADLKSRNVARGASAVEFTATDRQTRKLLELKKVSKSLGGRALFRDLDLVLAPQMKLGIIGSNGTGKTTLLRLLSGEIEPDAGEVRRADTLKIVRFDQNRQQLDPAELLRRSLSPMSDTVSWRGGAMHITSWAKRFLFRTDQLDLPVGELSGGEQARVLVARMMLLPADVLILDEPTNDLDINTLDVLEESLESFPGALVLVTHDRYLIDRLSTDLLALDGKGNAERYAALWQWEEAREFRDAQERENNAEKSKDARSQAAADAAGNAMYDGVAAPGVKRKRLTWNEQREWDAMEANILAAETKSKQLEARAAAPELLTDHVKMHEAYDALHAAQAEVERLYARWSELEHKQT